MKKLLSQYRTKIFLIVGHFPLLIVFAAKDIFVCIANLFASAKISETLLL